MYGVLTNRTIKRIVLVVTDFSVSVSSSYLLLNFVLRGSKDLPKYGLAPYVFGVAIYFAFAYVLELYGDKTYSKLKYVLSRSLFFGTLYSLGIYLITIFFFNTTVSRKYLLLFLIGMPTVVVFLKILCQNLFSFVPLRLKNVMYVYSHTFNKTTIKERIHLIEGKNYNKEYNVKLTVTDKNDAIFSRNSLKNALNKIDTIIVDKVKPTRKLEEYIMNSLFRANKVQTIEMFSENLYEKIPLEFTSTRVNYILEMKNKQEHPLNKLFSFAIDYLFILVISILLLFVIPIVFIINLFFNKGALFYTQDRVGKNGKIFKLYKFRSMVPNAEKRGAQMAVKNDGRVTLFGKILRKFRIDELPQIISIIKGDMHVIGPRPEREIFVNRLKEEHQFYDIRHIAKPGITGWAQVKYKYGETLEDSLKKLEYDLYYIKNKSIVLEIKILFKTVTTVLFSRGM